MKISSSVGKEKNFINALAYQGEGLTLPTLSFPGSGFPGSELGQQRREPLEKDALGTNPLGTRLCSAQPGLSPHSLRECPGQPGMREVLVPWFALTDSRTGAGAALGQRQQSPALWEALASPALQGRGGFAFWSTGTK